MGHPGPEDTALGTPVLAGAFRHVTNSYKHLFFRALLREVSGGRDRIPLARLASGMMEEAWWPGFHHRLNLGARDMVVARVAAAVDAEALRRDPHAVRTALEGAVAGPRDKLLRFVPQRFLRPWFVDETRGLADHRVDAPVTALGRAPPAHRCRSALTCWVVWRGSPGAWGFRRAGTPDPEVGKQLRRSEEYGLCWP